MDNDAHVLPPRTTVHLGQNSEKFKQKGLNVLEQINKDNGEFIKDRHGRYRIVYQDDDDINEYKTCIERVKIDTSDYSVEFIQKLNCLLDGLELQKRKRYPFSVTKNTNLLTVSKSNQYREGREFRPMFPKKDTTLYTHLRENPSVRLVADMITGFIHICKTTDMIKFRREEVQAMVALEGRAPEIYNVNRNEEDVSIHMEMIKGTRLDIVANYIRNEHLWPLSLHIFSELLDAINHLSKNELSHCDIHTKNVIIEITNENKIKIRLIDYGDASCYTIGNLMKDMRSLVASLLALFTRNDFDSYEEEPEKWIEEHPEIWINNPKLWDLLKSALDVKDYTCLTKLINYVSVIIGDKDKAIPHKDTLLEIASLIKKESNPSEDLARLSLNAQ